MHLALSTAQRRMRFAADSLRRKGHERMSWRRDKAEQYRNSGQDAYLSYPGNKVAHPAGSVHVTQSDWIIGATSGPIAITQMAVCAFPRFTLISSGPSGSWEGEGVTIGSVSRGLARPGAS